ncbi:hypothetical protein [Jiulongibacter sediminis]|uniref:hypothetical protein n=1 Tax=Jiulongibacter sediminis TaxID=1605367 RepID=UPI0026EAC704|nr:hypothetical protein [Jiulongibacter sediminis]
MMLFKNKIKFLFLPLLAVISCNSNVEKIDTSAVKAKMGEYKIKKVSEADIMASLNKMGTKSVNTLQETGCQIDSLEPEIARYLKPISFSDESQFEKEEGVLQALQYSVENGQTVEPTPQKLNDTLYAYYFLLDCDSLKAFKVEVSKGDLIRSMD